MRMNSSIQNQDNIGEIIWIHNEERWLEKLNTDGGISRVRDIFIKPLS